VLALLPADVDTLTDYGAGMPGLVRFADRTDAIHLLAFPRGARTGEFYEHGRWRSDEMPGRWTLAARAERRSQWTLEASLGTLMRPFVPCAVRLNGRPAADGEWTYDGDTAVLRARVVGRTIRLDVAECP